MYIFPLFLVKQVHCITYLYYIRKANTLSMYAQYHFRKLSHERSAIFTKIKHMKHISHYLKLVHISFTVLSNRDTQLFDAYTLWIFLVWNSLIVRFFVSKCGKMKYIYFHSFFFKFKVILCFTWTGRLYNTALYKYPLDIHRLYFVHRFNCTTKFLWKHAYLKVAKFFLVVSNI